jgi:hypothetical protein
MILEKYYNNLCLRCNLTLHHKYGLNDLSYNNKDMVQKTWSQAKYESEPLSDLEPDSDSDSSSFSSGVDLNEAVRRISEKNKLKNKV